MSINRRDFLTYSAAAGVVATPVVAATPTSSKVDGPRVASAENGLPIPDDWKGDEERFLMEWWAASFFFGQAAKHTLGSLGDAGWSFRLCLLATGALSHGKEIKE
jgi:hypothetical protein